MKRTEPPASFINYPELHRRRAQLGLYVQDLIDATGMGGATVSAVLGGDETVNLQSIVRLAEELGMRVIVDFEVIKPMETEEEMAAQIRPYKFERRTRLRCGRGAANRMIEASHVVENVHTGLLRPRASDRGLLFR